MDLLSLGKEPINPDHPGGSDVRYEPEFEELQAEIEKLSFPSADSSADGGVDWEKVTVLASAILFPIAAFSFSLSALPLYADEVPFGWPLT